MRAWLEREAPPGDDIELPDGSGTLVFGRSPRCTYVIDDRLLSNQHCEVSFSNGFWRVRDLGTTTGTRVNGSPITTTRALFPGDRLQFGEVVLRYVSDAPTEEPETLEAIIRSPDDPAAWLVYSDHLQERGDPLGERIARAVAGQRVEHMTWLGSLWDAFVAGEIEIDWSFGFIRRATFRTAAGRMQPNWREQLATLLNLRIGRFTRSLSIDLPRLQQLTAVHVPEELVKAQQYLAALPALPSSLERVSLGYHVAQPAGGAIDVSSELALRVPRLRGTPVYQRANAARLRVVNVSPGVKLNGIEGSRVLTGGTRLRRGERGTLFLEAAPGIPFLADGNPCYFSFSQGRAQLYCGRMRGEVRVNNRIDSLFELLPDDVIDVQGAAKFRLELVP
ncbi:MAG: FHA domain-containing protein [Archangium sp.]